MWRHIRGWTIGVALLAITLASIGTAGWMIYAASQSEVTYKQFAKNSAGADANRAREYVERDCRPLSPVARDKCVSEQIYAAQQAQHDDRDLEAQRTTAVWTRYLGIAGILGTAFGTVGVALVLLTFMEQRRSSRAELRAYLDISKTCVSIDDHPSIEVYYTNFGQTPATNVCVHIDFLLRTWPILDDPVPTSPPRAGGTVPPGHPRRFRYTFIKSEWDAMMVNAASFVIPVKITYDFLDGLGSDVFETCMVLSNDEAKRGECRYLYGRDRRPRAEQGKGEDA